MHVYIYIYLYTVMRSWKLSRAACTAWSPRQWEMVEEFEPLETKLYKQAVVKHPVDSWHVFLPGHTYVCVHMA